MLKEILRKAAHALIISFCYGAGMYLSFVAMFIVGKFIAEQTQLDDRFHVFMDEDEEIHTTPPGSDFGSQNDQACRRLSECKATAGLELKITQELIDKDQFVLLGNVTNNGNIKWDFITIPIRPS